MSARDSFSLYGFSKIYVESVGDETTRKATSRQCAKATDLNQAGAENGAMHPPQNGHRSIVR